MIIQVLIRLTLYLDQAIIRNSRHLGNDSLPGIENTVTEKSNETKETKNEYKN